MTVFATVADLVRQVREARQPVQGEWSDERGLVAWVDEDSVDRVIIARRRTHHLHPPTEWATHPAVFGLSEDEMRYAVRPEIAVAGWALEDGALDAVIDAHVSPEYARAAHIAGVTDAWALIEGWQAGIPVEFLSALGAAS